MANKPMKMFTLAEVEQQNDSENSENQLMVLFNGVYNLAHYMKEHPGGEEILQENLGKDATEAFEDVGHSEDAIKIMENYKIGEILESEQKTTNDKYIVENKSSFTISWIGPTAIVSICTVLICSIWVAKKKLFT